MLSLDAGIPSAQRRLEQDETLTRQATVAEQFETRFVQGGYRLLTLGMIPRMIEAELAGRTTPATGPERASLESVSASARDLMRDWLSLIDAGAGFTPVSIKRLVTAEVAGGLVVASSICGDA